MGNDGDIIYIYINWFLAHQTCGYEQAKCIGGNSFRWWFEWESGMCLTNMYLKPQVMDLYNLKRWNHMVWGSFRGDPSRILDITQPLDRSSQSKFPKVTSRKWDTLQTQGLLNSFTKMTPQHPAASIGTSESNHSTELIGGLVRKNPHDFVVGFFMICGSSRSSRSSHGISLDHFGPTNGGY